MAELHEMAVVAAKFRADFLRQNIVKHDAGMRDDQEIEFTKHLNFLGNMLRNSVKVSADQADIFEHELATIIQNKLENDQRYITFGVDYHPDMELSAAAELASFDADTMQFPVKTQMYIHDGQVTVKEGYGAPTRVIWPTE